MLPISCQAKRLMNLSAKAGLLMHAAYDAGDRKRAYHFMKKMYHFTRQAIDVMHGVAV